MADSPAEEFRGKPPGRSSIVMMTRAVVGPMVTSGGEDEQPRASPPRRQRALGPVMRSRAHRRVRRTRVATVLGGALLTVLGTASATVLSSTAAFANAPSPKATPMKTGSVLLNPNGTVTVTATGTWLWVYGTESAVTAGLAATVNHPCDSRSGVGWGVVWGDPDDPGFAETYVNKHGTRHSQMVHVGSRGKNPLNGDSAVLFNPQHRCGTFVQTNVPHPGDGYDTGTWRSVHTYNSVASLPTDICVITYDLGFARPPTPHRLNFDNNDNSVQWALFKQGSWELASTDDNCAQLPPPVAAPPQPTTTTTQPPPVKTVRHTSPPAPHVTPKPKPAGALAFTGFGRTGRLLALLGTILVLIGLVLYFVDVRKAAQWLVGW